MYSRYGCRKYYPEPNGPWAKKIRWFAFRTQSLCRTKIGPSIENSSIKKRCLFLGESIEWIPSHFHENEVKKNHSVIVWSVQHQTSNAPSIHHHLAAATHAYNHSSIYVWTCYDHVGQHQQSIFLSTNVWTEEARNNSAHQTTILLFLSSLFVHRTYVRVHIISLSRPSHSVLYHSRGELKWKKNHLEFS